jgi:hypothetical protein
LSEIGLKDKVSEHSEAKDLHAVDVEKINLDDDPSVR